MGVLGSGEACRDAKTNSGEGISDMWASKAERHGAAGAGRVWVVVDMVRRKEERRWAGLEAILYTLFGVKGKTQTEEKLQYCYNDDDIVGCKPCKAPLR